MERTLYLDMDGVLADFDHRADLILGTSSYKYEFTHGADMLWERLNSDPRFFASLPEMQDAGLLWACVRHLDPVVLTALPKGDRADVVAKQKREWIEKRFGALPVICCLSNDKAQYCRPGDILVDDRNLNEKRWKANGGTFIHHSNAYRTIAHLKKEGILQ